MRQGRADFYEHRGDFYNLAFSRETNAIRRETFRCEALRDFQHAMEINPFIDRVPEKIAYLQTVTSSLPSSNHATNHSTFFSGSLGAVASTPALTPAQRATVEAMKAQMQMQQSSSRK